VALLEPDAYVAEIDALMFGGGSSYGLGAANGVMHWLREKNRGVPTKGGVVPIVPSACVFDLSYKKSVIPGPNDAYQACCEAGPNNPLRGKVGAGTGTTVGKMLGKSRPMEGGFGRGYVESKNGVKVFACAVVNCVGDVIDQTGNIIAGAVDGAGEFCYTVKSAFAGVLGQEELQERHTNTVLVAVFTNAKLDKLSLRRVSRMASAGMARAIYPCFTTYDGDVVFSVSLGDLEVDEVLVGTLAAEAVQKSILDAVRPII